MTSLWAISPPVAQPVCKTFRRFCKTLTKTFAKSTASLGNGVTVAYRTLAEVVENAKGVLQTSPILIRLFPATSGPFAKLFAVSLPLYLGRLA